MAFQLTKLLMKILLFNWFDEVVQSEHSFAMPIFRVRGVEKSIIFAKAPYFITKDLKNAYNYLGNWQEGSEASYKISSANETEVKLSIEFTSERPDDTEFVFSLDKNEVLRFNSGERISSSFVIPEGQFLFSIKCTKTRNPGFALDQITLIPVEE